MNQKDEWKDMKKKNPIIKALLLLPALAALLCGCSAGKTQAFTKTDFFFDTVVTLTVYEKPSNKDKAEAILTDAMEKCRYYDTLFDPNNPDGDLYKINHAEGQEVAVSEETATLLYAALEFCKSTGGAIDITIEPAFELWNFTGENDSVPPEDRMNKALSHVDYGTVRLNGSRVTLLDPEAAITLGFIAKGYIADKLKESMIEAGAKDAIINLGGNVQTIGDKNGEGGYSVGIQKPFAATGEYIKTVTACEGKTHKSAVVTSGTYERMFKMNDRIYHHILDTQTGMPADTDLTSVTILADSAMEADAISTSCLILGSEQAKAYIEGITDIDAVFVKEDGEVIEIMH